MKIAYYCQHVLGIGHFHRSLEICKALTAAGHEVSMIVGGPETDTGATGMVSLFRLAPLKMNDSFQELGPCDSKHSLDEIKRLRRKNLLAFVHSFQPDCLIIELFPFGRKAFRFELDPLLETLSSNRNRCLVFCSLRDILVEKAQGLEKFERRAVATLNRYFDGLLIHADRQFIKLEQTFGRTGEIKIPVHYTGFITPKPSPDCRSRIRHTLFGDEDQKLIVASIGGGSVGEELLLAAANGVELLVAEGRKYHLQIFTGPYCSKKTARKLKEMETDAITVQTFSETFVDWLAAADLSISMAGYNTCMNTVAARVPALMYPFSRNREQRMRISTLWPDGTSVIELSPEDLTAARLSSLIKSQSERSCGSADIDINGAAATVKIVESRKNG